MNPVGLGCLFFGYLLVYAAIANHGRFATAPWAALIGDAYGKTGGVRAKAGGGGGGDYIVFGDTAGGGFLDDVELVG